MRCTASLKRSCDMKVVTIIFLAGFLVEAAVITILLSSLSCQDISACPIPNPKPTCTNQSSPREQNLSQCMLEIENLQKELGRHKYIITGGRIS